MSFFNVFSSSSGQKCSVSCRHHPEAPLIEDYRAGDMICSECGLVVGDRLVYTLIFHTSFTLRFIDIRACLISRNDFQASVKKPSFPSMFSCVLALLNQNLASLTRV